MDVEKKSNRGRKPVKDPKVQVSFYIEESFIKKNGGMDKAKEKCVKMLSK